MSYEFRLPDVGEGIHEAEIVSYEVQVGDAVKEDQMVLKIETDKAVVALPSPVSGTVKEIPHQIGDTVEVGQALMIFETVASASQEKTKEPAAAEQVEASPHIPQASTPAVESTVAPKRVLATPHTRNLARELSVDIQRISGSGRNGRITDEDVQRAASHPDLSPSEASVDTEPDVKLATPEPSNGKMSHEEYGPVRRIPFKGIRKRTAEAMKHSYDTIPHVWHAEDVDVTELFEVVKAQRPAAESQGIKLTSLAFITRAVVSALKQFPEVNSALDEASHEILLKEYYHIGIAVDTEHGLLVPVVRQADQKSVLHIAREIQRLVERAKSREIELEELQGGTFTLTNVGVIGGTHATPIINPPEVAILAIMAARETPVVHQAKVRVRRIMPLVIAFDHRVLDGALVARFMNHIKQLLEDPMRMLVELV
mgnify:CR=1 FL=1